MKKTAVDIVVTAVIVYGILGSLGGAAAMAFAFVEAFIR